MVNEISVESKLYRRRKKVKADGDGERPYVVEAYCVDGKFAFTVKHNHQEMYLPEAVVAQLLSQRDSIKSEIQRDLAMPRKQAEVARLWAALRRRRGGNVG